MAKADFQLAGYHDYALTLWRRMPVKEGSGGC
jgi:hypothetical protein